ncbi:hypothetical protein [Gordonia shandongensis]|uniref:hypothetical protein n=1 Tax=Gordonia shandongensis TaxID=376351 RepID=UPI00040CF190|nr:hypothetical protein [Gordonia shandongensis]
MNRTLNVARMQLINRKTFIWLPLIIFAAAFAISLVIYIAIDVSVDDLTEPMYGGGAQAPLWYFAVVGVQALSMTFPFSQAMSVTRREFYLGTTLTAVGAAALLAVVYLIGGLIEKATDGWGIDGYFFAVPWVWGGGAVGATVLYFMAPLLTFTVGFLAATVYKRFGMLWLVVIAVGFAVAAALAVLGISLADGWTSVGSWLAGMTPVGVGVTGLVVVAALSGLAYLTLRRAIP